MIDDDRIWKRVVCSRLEEAGYEVHEAADGRAGLEATGVLRPDLVLCDWVMPEMDGPSYCRRIRTDPELRRTYVALLTARGDREDLVAGLDSGADDYLVKPVALDELLARVRSGLRLRHLLDELVALEHRSALVELATTLGHEINNPLTALFGHMELMLQYLETGDRTRMGHHLRQSVEVASRIAEVSQMLASLREPRTKPYLEDLKMIDLERSVRRS